MAQDTATELARIEGYGQFFTTVESTETDVILTEDASFLPTCGCDRCGPAVTKDQIMFDDPDVLDEVAEALKEGANRLRGEE